MKLFKFRQNSHKKDLDDEPSNEIKNNFRLWAKDQADDSYFVSGIHQIIENEMITFDIQEQSRTQVELDHESYLFDRYLKKILNDILPNFQIPHPFLLMK